MKYSWKDKPTHKELVDLAFGKYRPDKIHGKERLLISENTDARILRLMSRLIKLEFCSALKKELESENNKENGGGSSAVPHPWDVYSIVPNARNGKISIAVCVNIKKRKYWFPLLCI